MDDIILKELHELKKLINEQNLLKKDVLNFSEACQYLDISESHLYKLTSRKQIPHFCPQGKKLYFNRQELDLWLQQNRQDTNDEIEKEATDYILQNRRR
jgi:excisionase family DNA binding protein